MYQPLNERFEQASKWELGQNYEGNGRLFSTTENLSVYH